MVKAAARMWRIRYWLRRMFLGCDSIEAKTRIAVVTFLLIAAMVVIDFYGQVQAIRGVWSWGA